jgi:hypothetical protein
MRDKPLGDHLCCDLSQTRPFQVLALKSFSVYQLTIWSFNHPNSAVPPALY